MSSAASKLLSLLTGGGGQPRENEDFELVIDDQGRVSTTGGPRFEQSGLGRVLATLGGDPTARDMNREFQNMLTEANMNSQLQKVQDHRRAQAQQELARLTNSLTGARELESFNRRRGAEVEDRDFNRANVVADREAQQQREDEVLAGAAARAGQEQYYTSLARDFNISPELAKDPGVKALLDDLVLSKLHNTISQNVTETGNRTALNRLGQTPTNVRGVGKLPLGALQALPGGTNLLENEDLNNARIDLIKSQTLRQGRMGQSLSPAEEMQAMMDAVQSLGSNSPTVVRLPNGQELITDGDQLRERGR